MGDRMKGLFISITGALGLVGCTGGGHSVSMPAGWQRDALRMPMLPMGLEYAENLNWTIRRITGRKEVPTKFSGESLYMPYYPMMAEEDRVWYAISYSATTRLDGEKGCNFAYTTMRDRAAIQRAVKKLTAKDWKDLAEAWGVEMKLAKQQVFAAFCGS